jgi:hypothetical protein
MVGRALPFYRDLDLSDQDPPEPAAVRDRYRDPDP